MFLEPLQLNRLLNIYHPISTCFPTQIKQHEMHDEKCAIKVCIPHICDNIKLIKEAFRLFEYRLCTPVFGATTLQLRAQHHMV